MLSKKYIKKTRINLLKKLINNQNIDSKKSKTKEHLTFQRIFGFCKSIKKTTKNLGFHVTFKTVGLQDIIFKTFGDGVNITSNNLEKFVGIFFPKAETGARSYVQSIYKE